MTAPTDAEPIEFTVDELARRANMTVRNVRAYTSRGLIDPPRLEGRTGYYSIHHLQRLTLIRSLVERGFTLTAVEEALARSPEAAPSLALDLISLFRAPDQCANAETITRHALEQVAGGPISDEVLAKFANIGLIAMDGDTITMRIPEVVQPAASSMALGLSPETVVDTITAAHGHVRALTADIVHRVGEELVKPFARSELTDEERDQVLHSVEAMIPLAAQGVLGIFKDEFQQAIEALLLKTLRNAAEQ